MIDILSFSGWLPLHRKIVLEYGLVEAAVLSAIISRRQYAVKTGAITPSGLFPYSVSELQGDLGLKKDAQKTALDALSNFGLVQTELAGMPSTRHVRIMPGASEKIQALFAEQQPAALADPVKRRKQQEPAPAKPNPTSTYVDVWREKFEAYKNAKQEPGLEMPSLADKQVYALNGIVRKLQARKKAKGEDVTPDQAAVLLGAFFDAIIEKLIDVYWMDTFLPASILANFDDAIIRLSKGASHKNQRLVDADKLKQYAR